MITVFQQKHEFHRICINLTVDDSNIEDMMVQGRRSSTPVSTENSQQTSPKEKRRFTFGFLERKPAGSATATPGSSSEAVTSR